MIKHLAKLPYWEIAAIGLCSTIAIMSGLILATHWVVNTWPQAAQPANVGYLILNAATAWVLVGITVEACMLRRRNKVIAAAVEKMINLIMNPKGESGHA